MLKETLKDSWIIVGIFIFLTIAVLVKTVAIPAFEYQVDKVRSDFQADFEGNLDKLHENFK